MERVKHIIIRFMNKGSEHFFYVGATLITAMVHFFYSVYAKVYIDPKEFGIYSSCLLLKTYFSYIQLGSLNAFNRDYPQLIGANNIEKAKQYRDTTFSYLVSVFSVLAIVISIVVLFIGNKTNADDRYIYGLMLCTVITATTIIENFLCSRVRIDGDFKYTSLVILLELIATAVGFVIIPILGYYSLYFVMIGASSIGIALYYKRGISDINFHVDRDVLVSIILSGLPLLINNLIWTVVDSIDKFVILGFMNAEKLGVYSIAQMAFSYMILIPSAMSQLFYVNLGKVYGASSSEEQLNKTAIEYTLVIAIVMSLFALTAFYFIAPLVNLIMPKYKDGVESAQILILALAIYTPTMVNGNILTILKRNAALLRSSVYLCVLNAVCSVGFVMILGARIESVALGTAVSYLLRTAILVIQLKREAGADVIKMLNASIIPVMIIAGPGIIIYNLFAVSWVGVGLAFIIAISVSLLAYGKRLLVILNREK